MEDLHRRVGTILNGTASGMIPMAIFTPVYAFWGLLAWPLPGGVLLALALAWSGYLAVTARTLLRLGRKLPHEKTPFDARITTGMTIISSIQGGAILLAIIALTLTGLWVWILPVVTLIVALHFYPMPALFDRSIDYYLGTAMLIAAVAGLVLTALSADWQLVWAIAGTGGTLVTVSYAVYMLRVAQRTLRGYEALIEDSSV